MKQIILFFTAILFLACSCQNNLETTEKASLENFADSLFHANVDSTQIAGGAILVYQKDKLLLDKSYGYASLELSTPMPMDAIFEIGSVTKQFTAAAILKLVEAKKLALDDDFTKYLEYDTKGRKVTINHLLNHTSGIPSYTEIPEFGRFSIQEYPRDSLVRLLEQKDFLFEPGEALIYNNSGYFFLGLIIEKVSGQSYEEYLNETFFIPLGMKNTHYSSMSRVIKNKVYGYNYSRDGLQQKDYLNHLWPYAAGSLCSTTSDLLTWMKAMHNGEVLSESLYQSIIEPAVLKDGSHARYAKGLVNFSNLGHPSIAHGGGIHGFLSETRYFTEEDLYVICLVNTIGPRGASYFAEEISWNLLDKKTPMPVKLDIELEKLSGTYSGAARGRSISIEVHVVDEILSTQFKGRTRVDTLNIYIGNNTWMQGNDIIKIKNGEYHVDNVYGYYILKKDE